MPAGSVGHGLGGTVWGSPYECCWAAQIGHLWAGSCHRLHLLLVSVPVTAPTHAVSVQGQYKQWHLPVPLIQRTVPAIPQPFGGYSSPETRLPLLVR